jgi:hypothetical protein
MGAVRMMPESRHVRIVDIAELLGVTHQRASRIVEAPGFPAPVGREEGAALESE